MNRKFAFISVLVLSMLLLVVFISRSEDTKCKFASFEDSHRLTLKVAENETELESGLMNVSDLPENSGMLFKFDREQNRSFWMKNTFIPLDLVYLDSNYRVVDIDQMDPEPGVADENLTRYWSDAPAMYALEVNQGWVENNSVEMDDRLSLSGTAVCNY